MSRLINPGLGDLLDRLTILALKILHKGAQDHWVRERNALLAKVNGRGGHAGVTEALLELAAINAALWQATDDLRPYVGTQIDVHRAVAGVLGLQILTLNDRRAALVDQINALVGEDRGGEKG